MGPSGISHLALLQYIYIFMHIYCDPRGYFCDPRGYFTVEVLVVKLFTLLVIYIYIYICINIYILKES